MVTLAQAGPDTQRYFTAKAHSRSHPGFRKNNAPRSLTSPKAPLSPSSHTPNQKPQSKPKSPSCFKQSPRPKPTSPKPIMNYQNSLHFNSPSPVSFSPPSHSSSYSNSYSSTPYHSYRVSHTPSPSQSSRSSPSRASPNNFASSTCYQPPTPESLPKPPLSWTQSAPPILCSTPPPMVTDPTTHLRLLLNVQA